MNALIPMIAAAGVLSTACVYTPAIEPRPDSWAQPIQSPRLSNLHQVSPELYRCALPDEEGYQAAQELGIQTIINLRPSKSAETPEGTIANYINIPVHTGSPTYDQARE
ncbi:MAG: hypothetical protein WBG04_09985, partial [Haloferula sp.]